MEEKEIFGWFVFNSGQLLIVKDSEGKYHIPYGPEPPVNVPVGSTIHTIGEIYGHTAKAYAIYSPVPGNEDSERMMKDLRASYDVLSFEEYYRAGKASQILNWDKNSRYCPMCGVPTVQVSPIAKRCPECPGMPTGILSAHIPGCDSSHKERRQGSVSSCEKLQRPI